MSGSLCGWCWACCPSLGQFILSPWSLLSPPWGSSPYPLGASSHLSGASSYLPADVLRGSDDSCRVDTHRGEARVLGTVLGVTNGRPESRRPAGVGRPDARAVLAGVLTGPEGRRAGVLWATLGRQDPGARPSAQTEVLTRREALFPQNGFQQHRRWVRACRQPCLAWPPVPPGLGPPLSSQAPVRRACTLQGPEDSCAGGPETDATFTGTDSPTGQRLRPAEPM